MTIGTAAITAEMLNRRQPVHAGKAHVEDDQLGRARCATSSSPCSAEEAVSALMPQPFGEPFEPPANRRFVVNDQTGAWQLPPLFELVHETTRRTASPIVAVPASASASCCSAICRATASPRPVPSGLSLSERFE